MPFIDNWFRHPNTLSGGEMEILNIVTAFTSPSDAIFIDDGFNHLMFMLTIARHIDHIVIISF